MMRAMGVADEVLGLFIAQGSNSYAEQVTMEEHARQAAALAQAEGASDAWVLAALLHDIGHFLEEPDSEFGVTDHGTSGGMWLAERFVEEVSEPVRLHVAAKRYRCFVDPDYQSRLSSASVGTLRLQGGPMSADEAEIFEAESYADGALAVRSWDDGGKVDGLDVPSLFAWQTLLEDSRFHR
jgi:gamma-butyrobetaine dioxygenase